LKLKPSAIISLWVSNSMMVSSLRETFHSRDRR
jgi:hypothetical protein